MASPAVYGAMLKVAGPLAAIGIVFVVLRLRRFPPRAFLALRTPPAGRTIAWLAGYVAFMLLSDAWMGWRGPWDFSRWRADPLAVDAMRVLAVCFLGPIAEELVFRGLLFTALGRRLAPAIVVVVTAAAWAMIHVSYDWPIIALLFVSGVMLGAARWTTRSVIPPIVMHVAWNLYAIW